MAIGDDAAAAGMAVVDGATTPANTIDTELNLTRDYIAQGKGASTAATANKIVKRDAAGRAQVAVPAVAADIATKGYVDGRTTSSLVSGATTARVTAAGYFDFLVDGATKFSVTPSGDISPVRNVSASGQIHAGSHIGADGDVTAEGHGQFSAAWGNNITTTRRAVVMNSSGRLGYTSGTAARLITAVQPWDGLTDEQFAALQVVTYRPRDSDDVDLGIIADTLADLGLEWAVFRDDQGRPEGIHYERVVLAVIPYVQRLAARVAALEEAG